MKALILNSGLGSRLGEETRKHPKCMTKLTETETILSRQLLMLKRSGIEDIVITTGYFEQILTSYCRSLESSKKIVFIHNPAYDRTNYIYSIYCAKELLDDDILLLHGDLVFDWEVLNHLIHSDVSCMVAETGKELPDKDFKAVVYDGKIVKIGVEYFEHAIAVQPLYWLKKRDWRVWLESICHFCETGKRNHYAEDAFNDVSGKCVIHPMDIGNLFCEEVDNCEDLKKVRDILCG